MSTVLELRFDEPIGSTIAQDFSGFGRDATLKGDYIAPGRLGNSLFAKALGVTDVPENPLDLNADFTIYFWLLCGFDTGSTHTIRAYIGFEGIDDQLLQMNFATAANTWSMITLTREGSVFRAYTDGKLTDSFTAPNGYIADGIFFLKEYLIGSISQALDGSYIDSLTLITGQAYNAGQIKDLIFEHTEKLVHKIEGQNLTLDLGWTVEKSSGLFDRGGSKAQSYDWEDRHGIAVDVFSPRYKERRIELEIWQKFTTKEDAFDGIAALKALVSKSGLIRFEFYGGSRMVAYQVFLPDGIEIQVDKWVEPKIVAKTTLVMIEPEPVKKIVQFVRTGSDNKTATVSFNANRELFNIYWGDGTMTPNVTGATASASHDYSADGVYVIIIAGVIEKMESFTSNTSSIWPIFI